MNQGFVRALAAAGLGCALAGCGGGNNGNADISVNGNSSGAGGGFSAFCDTINGAGAATTSSIDPGCIECSVADPAAAADDSAHSAAIVTITQAEAGQGAAIRSTAPGGRIYPAGSNVGVFYSRGGPTGSANVIGGGDGVVLRLYRGGVLVDQTSPLPGFNAGTPLDQSLKYRDLPTSGDASLPHAYAWFTAQQSFDAVEMQATTPGVITVELGPPLVFQVYGLCSNSGVSD